MERELMIYNTLAVLVFGIVIGAALVRYGISVGTKIIYQIKNDLPLDGEIAEMPSATGQLEDKENA